MLRILEQEQQIQCHPLLLVINVRKQPLLGMPFPLYIDLGILDLVLNFFFWLSSVEIHWCAKKYIFSKSLLVLHGLSFFHSSMCIPSFKGAPDSIKDLLSFLRQVKGIPPLYILAVALYMLPNLLAAVLFLFPMLRRENSDWHIVRFLLWWSQVLMLPYFLTYFIHLHISFNSLDGYKL